MQTAPVITIKIKIKILGRKIKTVFLNFLLISIVFLKYVSVFGFIGYIAYVAKPTYNNIVYMEKREHKLALQNIFRVKEIAKKIPMVKSCIITVKNHNILITPIYREPKFKFKGKIYDIEGKIIKENIENENQYTLIIVKGDNENFFEIFQMFKIFNHCDMEYNGLRWNVYIYHKDKKFTIKLPIEINEWTEKKIEFLILNRDLCFDDSFPIIDLRFGDDKIHLVKS